MGRGWGGAGGGGEWGGGDGVVGSEGVKESWYKKEGYSGWQRVGVAVNENVSLISFHFYIALIQIIQMGVITLNNMFNKPSGFIEEKYEGRRETEKKMYSTCNVKTKYSQVECLGFEFRLSHGHFSS